MTTITTDTDYNPEDLDELADGVLDALYGGFGRMTGDHVWDVTRAGMFAAVLDYVRQQVTDRTKRPRCGVCGGSFGEDGKCPDGCATWANGSPELGSQAVTLWIDGGNLKQADGITNT